MGLYCRTSLTRHLLLCVFCSALLPDTSGILWLLLTSASSSIHYCMACYPQPADRPPRVRTIAFIPSTRCIYRVESGQYGTSFCLANSSTPLRPYMQFLFIEPGFCLQLLSDSTSRWTPLLLANSSYCQACEGLSPLGYYSCRAYKKGGRP